MNTRFLIPALLTALAPRIAIYNGPKAAGDRKPWFSIKNEAKADAAEITIYERIGYDWWSGDGIEAKGFCEELKAIPMGRKITLRINSQGGNVHDGLVIYNRLKERRNDLTVKIDGVAASIASVIALAGGKIEMPRNALLMIHNPWAAAEGDAATMRQAADMLDRHRDSLIAVYEEKIGKDQTDQIKSWMDAETWMTGDQAKANGFADVVTDEQISFQACSGWDLGGFKRVPEQLKGNPAADNSKNKDMNRKAILARLKELGVTFNEKDSTEALNTLLAQEELKAQNRSSESSVEAGDDTEVEGEGDDDAADPGDPNRRSNPPTNKPKARGTKPAVAAVSAADYNQLLGRVTASEKRYQAQRKLNITNAVRDCVNEDRIPAAQEEVWVNRILKASTEEDGDAILADLQAMPQRPPGIQPVGIVITSEDPKDIERGILNLRRPIESFRKGNDIDSKIIAANAKTMAMEIEKHRKKLEHALATNTVDPALKRNVLLADFMRAFARKITRLSIFSTTYSNIPLQGTNKMTVPFYDLDTTTSKNYSAANGYEFDHDTQTGERTLTINKRKYKPMTFSSEEFRRQPYFRPDVNFALMAEQLALDVWLDVLGGVVRSNFGSPVFNAEAGTFDSDDMMALRKIAQDNDWPDTGRSCLLTTDFELALLQDDAIKDASKSGSNAALREGSTGRVADFDMYYSPRIPRNSEGLVGFICLPPAYMVGTAPIAPAPGVRSQLLSYDVVTHPELNVSFEYRYWGEAQMDKDREVVECNFGHAKGNASALKLISDGEAEYSSSSSASSVNSSSSSSSSASF